MKTILFCVFISLSQILIAEEIKGNIVRVIDGDTVTILHNKNEIKVRLEGIDSPETGQDYSNKSKQALSKMVFGKEVLLKKSGTDKYNRTLGIIFVDNINVNSKMIEDGWAWHYKRYSNDDELAELEVNAKRLKRGLWQDENPIAPWEYRLNKKYPKKVEGYWLNTPTNVRHNSNCKYYQNTKKGRTCGKDEGAPCGICGG